MKLKRLIKDLPVKEVKGSKEIEITGICSHSKQVVPGNLFIAKKGSKVDGSQYIPEAIATGAVAVLNDMYDPTLRVSQIIHPNVSELEGLLASSYHHRPSQEMLMIGVTGTNGKTTISYLIKHLFDSQDVPCGLIGTIEYLLGAHAVRATHTTPDVTTNHKMLREMVNHGCRAAVMEVTSHALHQRRVDEIAFDVGVFTNLSPEHLDYHGTMEAYAGEKSRLFQSLDPTLKKKGNYPKAAVINADDRWSQEMIKQCAVPVISYGIANQADLMAADIELKPNGISYRLLYQNAVYPVELPLIGRFNVYNSLAAIACGISQKIPLDQILESVRTFRPVSGRLERVPNLQGLKVYVDFAHTPDALTNVLKCLRELTTGRLITVFGCGGDRDPYKRPKMGEIAEQYSDLTVITSDNPRSENPVQIMSEIAKGFKNSAHYILKEDRKEAIKSAICAANPEDLVLIAGRGHEPYQTFAHHTIEFNDREEAEAILKSWKKVNA
jgi:UDP-N-acetylmuramoyl-L-alanyl-D-glutamate--2,6-diaminopimelate ligase